MTKAYYFSLCLFLIKSSTNKKEKFWWDKWINDRGDYPFTCRIENLTQHELFTKKTKRFYLNVSFSHGTNPISIFSEDYGGRNIKDFRDVTCFYYKDK